MPILPICKKPDLIGHKARKICKVIFEIHIRALPYFEKLAQSCQISQIYAK